MERLIKLSTSLPCVRPFWKKPYPEELVFCPGYRFPPAERRRWRAEFLLFLHPPNSPFSPACGFRPATPILGFFDPESFAAFVRKTDNLQNPNPFLQHHRHCEERRVWTRVRRGACHVPASSNIFVNGYTRHRFLYVRSKWCPARSIASLFNAVWLQWRQLRGS